MFVQPVPGDEDLLAFRFDFGIEGKAVEDGSIEPTVTETEDGDLIIEGYAAVFDGLDREGENFADGSFEHGIKSFLNGQAGLCYHHKHDKCLGKVLSLENEQGKGLRMKARVDGAVKKHPELGVYYEQIKKGTLNALSVGGFFKRGLVDGVKKITGVDFTEISVTPVPVHPGTNFAVVAGKALASDLKVPNNVKLDTLPEDEIRDSDFEEIQWALETLGRTFDRIGKRNSDNEALT